jgi:hypothetical protein
VLLAQLHAAEAEAAAARLREALAASDAGGQLRARRQPLQPRFPC